MPWQTPALRAVRTQVRDDIRGSLPGADASVPNSVLRVISDAQAGLCHLNLQYLDWLALQLLPDTAEHEWLDRHGQIWLVNASGMPGRKQATFAFGTASFTGIFGVVLPAGTRLEGGVGVTVEYETVSDITIGHAETIAEVSALDSGTVGNLTEGTALGIIGIVPEGVNSSAIVVNMTGGVDVENDDDLRARILSRIRQPPQGGAAHDYVNWTLAVPGVTRAWCAPNEMGMGTVTVRFMMDELRADQDGFPTPYDCGIVAGYLDTMRPVAVKDMFVVAPIPQPIDVFIQRLNPDTESVRAAIEKSVKDMLFQAAAPGATIYAAWKSAAIMNAADVQSFHLYGNEDDVMPSPGHMATLGDISFT